MLDVQGNTIGIGVTDGDFTFNNDSFDGINENVKFVANNIICQRDSLDGPDINTTGAVELRAVVGNIRENEINDGLDVTCAAAILYSKLGIGDNNPIEINTGNLTAVNDISGDINFNIIGNTVLDNISNVNGDITIVGDSDLTVEDITGQDIELNANNAIKDDGDNKTQITGVNLALTANNGIGSNDSLETNVDVLVVSNTSGNISIDNQGDLEIGNAGVTNTSTTNTGDINITTTEDMILTGEVMAKNGGFNLTSILGSILDNNGNNDNLYATNDSSLTAWDSIGTPNDAIEVEMNEALLTLTANNCISIFFKDKNLNYITNNCPNIYINDVANGPNDNILSEFINKDASTLNCIGDNLFVERGRYIESGLIFAIKGWLYTWKSFAKIPEYLKFVYVRIVSVQKCWKA